MFVVKEDDYLAHYGVLGMKWGVHKNPQQARSKANKKLSKLDTKVQKARAKSGRAKEKALGDQAKSDTAILFKRYKSKRAAKSSIRSQRMEQKAVRKQIKAQRWAKQMEKAFKDTKVSDTKEEAALGKKYLEMDLNELMRTNLLNIQTANLYVNSYNRRVR